MTFGFIAKHRGIWPVSWLCGALDVSRSGFHAWLVRTPSARSRSGEEYAGKIRASFISSYRTYGARRVWHDLLAEGLSCGLHRVERLMRLHGLMARPRRRGLPKDDGVRSVIASNVLDRQFSANAPNQKWVADFTYIWTAEGWLYAAAVIDLFSRRLVGWSMSDTMTAQLVTDALVMAIWRRGKPDALLHHSDQGSQYTSEKFQRLMADNGVTCSMNQYNLAHRGDDALIDMLATKGVAYVPFFPLGGFNPLQSSALSHVAERLSATPMQVALAWLLQRAPNILLIPGTSSVAHLHENLAAASLKLPEEAVVELNAIG
jgi:putative transposase